MKKNIYGLVLLILSVILGTVTGFYNGERSVSEDVDNRKYAQAAILYNGFDNVLEDADVIVSGTIEFINVYDEYDEYVISVTDTKKGDVVGQIPVRNYLYEYSYLDGDKEMSGKTTIDYEIGQEYIFILQHVENVYEDIYMILSDVYIPLDNIEASTILSSNIENIENCEEYIEQYSFRDADGKGKELSSDYIDSDDESVILKESSYIALVEVQELYRSTEIVDVYACNVVKHVKGDITTTSDNQILIPFFSNTVDVGENYIVCLSSDNDSSIIYTLSSSNSVIDASRFDFVKSFVE